MQRTQVDSWKNSSKNSRAFFRDRPKIRSPVSAVAIPQNSRDYRGRSTVTDEFDSTSGMSGMRNAFIYQKCYRDRSVKIIQLIIATLFNTLRVTWLFDQDYISSYISRSYIIMQKNQRKMTKGTKRWLVFSAAESKSRSTRLVELKIFQEPYFPETNEIVR